MSIEHQEGLEPSHGSFADFCVNRFAIGAGLMSHCSNLTLISKPHSFHFEYYSMKYRLRCGRWEFRYPYGFYRDGFQNRSLTFRLPSNVPKV